MEPLKPAHLGKVLVVGGCGFVGYHIVRHLILETGCTSVSVISRNPHVNRVVGVSYHAGDITNLTSLRALVSRICPRAIIHTAVPAATSASAKDFNDVTIRGTSNLLQVAGEIYAVKAFIFTSSATAAAGPEHINLDETTELADAIASSHPCAKTKARADRIVLTANMPPTTEDSYLLTACIRLPIVYGERDLLFVPGALKALERGQTNFQLGDGSNLWDFVSADNAARAHILLAKALLTPRGTGPKVGGEAFNITDGERHRFWDFARLIWKAAGYENKEEYIWALPTWFAPVVADVLAWVYWIFLLGTKQPGLLKRQQVEYSCFTHTYSIEKAREGLGYDPVPEFEEGIQRAVAWLLANNGWSSRLKKVE